MNSSGNSQPVIGVHVLTEFVYCARAGIVAYRQNKEDTGEEAPRLDYLPDFDVVAMNDSLQQIKANIHRAWAVLPLVVAGLAVVVFFVDWMLGLVLCAALLFPLRWFLHQCWLATKLDRKLRHARTAPSAEPQLPIFRTEPVNWWSLMQAGFVAVEYEDAHYDNTLQVCGKPWRVLQKGSLRIPVFRKRHGDSELRLQHFIRMTAYCHLMQVCELADSPYGIVLFGDGYDGLAVPVLDEYRRQFEQALETSRNILQPFEARGMMPPWPNPTACRKCPWGLPVKLQEADVARIHARIHARTVRDVHAVRSPRDRCHYRCPCGETFGWAPPHQNAVRLQLPGNQDVISNF